MNLPLPTGGGQGEGAPRYRRYKPASFDRAPRMLPAKENPSWMGPPKTPREFGQRCLYEVLIIGAIGVVAFGAMSATNAKVDPFN